MVDSFGIVLSALGALGWGMIAAMWIIDGVDGTRWQERCLAIGAAMYVVFDLTGIVLEQLASV